MEHNKPEDLSQTWGTMDGSKGDLKERSEQYAMWTVPSICPVDHTEGTEQSKGNVAIGARLLNHLSNRVVDTMFPSDRPFFRLPLTNEAEDKLTEMYIGQNGEVAEDKLAKHIAKIKKATTAVENSAMRELNLTAYRPVAVQAVQHMIVTGNAVVHRTKSGKRVVYGVKDFCIERDVEGNPLKLILRDGKMFGGLPEVIQNTLRDMRNGKDYKDDSEVTLYTYYGRASATDKWKRWQGVDELVIEETYKTYSEAEFPCLPLTWNLARGRNYATGLVEDHTVLFHNVDVTTQALVDLVGLAADFKFLISAQSMIDIDEWNNAARGSYQQGEKDDISVPDFPKRVELEILRAIIAEWERELAQSFLLNSAGVRDAERVTAEEIRFYARELESAFGGLYSRLALDWQQREAEYLITQVDFKLITESGLKTFDVVVTTGLESLSREGQLDSLRLAVGDLQMLEAVPEDIRRVIDARAFAEFVFTNRGINLATFVYTKEQLAEQQKQEQAQQERLMQQQTQQQVAAESGKAAVRKQ